MKNGAIILLALAAADAAGGVDSEAFYAKRERQIFKREDARELEHGYVKGDDVPYFTWEGSVSGKSLYVEVHGEQIKLITGAKTTVLPFIKALMLAGGDMDARALDEKGPDLYVKSTKNLGASLVCVESLGPDTYMRPRPYREVYLVTAPLGDPHLYRLSGINASCKGIEQTAAGKLLVPTWDISRNRTPSVVIDYYAIEKGEFKKTGIRILGSIADDYATEYDIEPTQ
jgi:hypothetical protein